MVTSLLLNFIRNQIQQVGGTNIDTGLREQGSYLPAVVGLVIKEVEDQV